MIRLLIAVLVAAALAQVVVPAAHVLRSVLDAGALGGALVLVIWLIASAFLPRRY